MLAAARGTHRMRHSPLRQLALSIWLNHKPSERYMAMFTAYFDSSGKESSTTMSIGGFVSDMAKWLRFEKEWYALLDEHGIENPFHMTDFMAAKSDKYRPWKGRWNDFLTPALYLIKRRINKSFAYVVSLDAVARMHREFVIPSTHYLATDIRRPLALCGMATIHKVISWANAKSEEGLDIDDLRIVFDRGDEHRGALAAAIRKEYHIEPTFESKEKLPPLQAADIVAWYMAKGLRDLHRGRHTPPPGWLHMVNQLPGSGQWSQGDWAMVEHVAKQQGFARRGSQ